MAPTTLMVWSPGEIATARDSTFLAAPKAPAVKRFRVATHDFDTRAAYLDLVIQDHWETPLKESHERNKEDIRNGLRKQLGEADFDRKLTNFMEIGPKPFSVLAFHNKFSDQIRRAFVVGAYYPALVAACALGERILNHLVLLLRDDFQSSPEYKHVHRKDSFDNWRVPIRALENWGVLLPDVVAAFEELAQVRNRAVHFDPQTDAQDRPLALDAIRLLTRVTDGQFSSFGTQPWFIPATRGAGFLTRASESLPFVRKIYTPSSAYVGPWHQIHHLDTGELVVEDAYPYDDRALTDSEYRELYHAGPPKRVLRV